MAKNEDPMEEMTVELSLDNGQDVTCAVITILEVEGQFHGHLLHGFFVLCHSKSPLFVMICGVL